MIHCTDIETNCRCSMFYASHVWWSKSVAACLVDLHHSISRQPRRAYYKFPEPEPRLAGVASLSWDHLCGTVFLLLYGDQRWLCTLSRDNWRPICSTSDVLANRRNIQHHPALLWRFRDSGTGYKTADLRAIHTDQFSGTSSQCQFLVSVAGRRTEHALY